MEDGIVEDQEVPIGCALADSRQAFLARLCGCSMQRRCATRLVLKCFEQTLLEWSLRDKLRKKHASVFLDKPINVDSKDNKAFRKYASLMRRSLNDCATT